MKIIKFLKKVLNKYVLFSFILIIIYFLFLIVKYDVHISIYKNENINENYEYTYSKCNWSDYSWNNNLVNSIYWEKWNLIVKTKIDLNCGVDRQKWLVNITNGNIILDINPAWNPDLTACDCDFDTKFKIKNISQKDYNIILNKEWNKIDSFTFKKNWVVVDKCKDDLSYSCYFPMLVDYISETTRGEKLTIHNHEIEIK